ncbi:bifunctional lysylphosphatidylglycerol synthetase/lysine--tRNA ligase LysX [Gordonia amarae]|nr:lysyl-tRNA synthetase class 2 [Gordonia amarae]QHN15768.1 bifunctional lysylphosphatidylglycerol synthetase/lysine--tRNA ligase LysX [Gordonia amarae]QHN20337.1 bifunctional lysylphosphatidylglycerol synthetase/lysine--tRNA ligase LysX [Gordonia amarae]QHN29188.1 bifunctional lysylphosphatidylglycerol synthetase/lysine--tRNA ligase LysX [Gordonia amarae]QHN37967.1 bifunctional lysylphosphatidylglycerol synthetase/lysine--tRNA ligase LysX [Gordonia amarae]
MLTGAGFLSLIEIVTRDWRPVDYLTDALNVIGIPADRSLYVALLVFVLAGAIRRRFVVAYAVLMVLQLLNLISLVVIVYRAEHGYDHYHVYETWHERSPIAWTALGAGIIAALALALSRRAFTARLAGGSIPAALGVFAAGMTVSWLVAISLTGIAPHHLHGLREKLHWSVLATLGDHVAPHAPYFHGHQGSHWVFTVVGITSAIALILALLVLSRANHSNQFLSREDELDVRRLLARYSEDDSLGYFATRRDKSVVFSPDRRAAVLFRVVGSVSVAGADPVGDRESWAAAVDAWLLNCREHGVHAVVLAAGDHGAQVYRHAGLRTLDMGDEAIIDVGSFTVRGPAMKPVRQAVNRVAAAGYTARVRRHRELTDAEVTTIAGLAEQWRGEDVERGFSMALNRFGDPVDGNCVLITAHGPDGRIRGLLSFVPWGLRGISLDLMRRDRDGDNGVIEFLVVRMIEHCRSAGISRISLNFAMFRSVYANADKVGAGPITRGVDAVLDFASRFYQLNQLYRSNQKYRPTWVPRIMCYQPPLSVVRAALAGGIAEGFVPKLGPAVLTGPGVPEDQEIRADSEFLSAVAAIETEQRRRPLPDRRPGDQQRARLAKIGMLDALSMSSYPPGVTRDADIAGVRAGFAELPPDTETGVVVSVVGRARGVRDFGGLVFVDLAESGARIQAMFDAAQSDPGAHTALRVGVDIGDLISVTGQVCTTRTGELSILVRRWQMAAKCISPVPAPGAELTDEVRTRNRTLELLTDFSATELLVQRSCGVLALRNTLQEAGFLEVETPILQTVHGGAAAHPFTTHINAYDMPLTLRIAPELYLKRLVVAGMPRIYELGRNFRNEGADATHNPEFTALEVYQAYADYRVMARLARELIVAAAVAVNGAPVAKRRGGTVDLTGEWPEITVHQAVSLATGVPVTAGTGAAQLAEICRDHTVEVAPDASAGQLVMKLYEALVEKQTVTPTFYYDFPVEVSPLARPHRDDPRLTEHWDLVAFGAEVGTAYSELTDPVDQGERLLAQSFAAAGGDPEAMAFDDDFVRALGYGMPPTGGLGLGVDRLMMMLTDVPIRRTLTFPFVKPLDNT